MNQTHQKAPLPGVQKGLLRSYLRSHRAGFSLIEISMAIAIVGVCFVALLGLLTPGLSNFRVAMNTQTSAEISQRLASELQESDFDALLASKAAIGGDNGQFYRLVYRYYDNQGQEVRVTTPGNLSDAEKARVVYTVRVRGSFPGNPDPKAHSASYFTSLPGVKAPRFNPRDVTFLSIQVILSQGRDVEALVEPGTYLIKPETATKGGMPLRTYSILVARNGYS
jgi:uncharacterized protein (TIGR02598 family)